MPRCQMHRFHKDVDKGRCCNTATERIDIVGFYDKPYWVCPWHKGYYRREGCTLEVIRRANKA